MKVTQLKIAKDLVLPDDAVTETFAILARKGAGKTHTASVIAEEMLDQGLPIVVFDPLGVWWGLRSDYPVVILGGEHADVPLEPSAGKIVAEFAVAERVPIILDLVEMGEMEMCRLVGDFAKRFYQLNREAVHIFVDEADAFAPQSGAKGPRAVCLGAMQNIVRRGRSKGIGTTMITQRSAVLNKDLLTQAECLIAMQTTGPHDLKAIEGWIRYQDDIEPQEILKQLPRLKQGEAFVYSPAWLGFLKRVKIRKRRTFDSSRTPKPGERRTQPKRTAEVDLAALGEKMAATIERAKADDPRELRSQISKLKRDLRDAEKRLAEKKEDVQPIITSEQDAEFMRLLGHHQSEQEKFVREFMAWFGQLTIKARKVRNAAAHAKPKPAQKTPPEKRPAVPRLNLEGIEPLEEGVTLGKCERAVLRALYWLAGETPSKAKIAFHAGYSARSSGFSNALSRLRSLGLVQRIQITGQGEALIRNEAGEKPSGAELREWLRTRLGRCENVVLDALIEQYPKRLSIEEIAGATEYSAKSSGLSNALSRLRTIEAADGYRDGGIKAADVFLE